MKELREIKICSLCHWFKNISEKSIKDDMSKEQALVMTWQGVNLHSNSPKLGQYFVKWKNHKLNHLKQKPTLAETTESNHSVCALGAGRFPNPAQEKPSPVSLLPLANEVVYPMFGQQTTVCVTLFARQMWFILSATENHSHCTVWSNLSAVWKGGRRQDDGEVFK